MPDLTDREPAGVPPATGSLIAGRYLLGSRVGRGGMADVYSAEDRILGRSVAVKIFRIDATPDARRRIDSEMRTLAVLRNPGLVTVFDAGTITDDGVETPYLVMELVIGPTLSSLLHGGPLAADEVARIGAELAQTLAYVHANKIVHRDIKPANILLDTEHAGPWPYTAKLADFGISKVADDTRYTIDGTTVGTPNYLSPEQAQGLEISPASDVYSLGLVLLECLTGSVVYPGSGVAAAVARLHRRPSVPARFGPRWQEVLTAMTADDPSARPQPMQIVDALTATPATPGAATPAAVAPTPVAAAPTAVMPAPGTATAVLDELPPHSTTLLAPAPPEAAPARRRVAVWAAGGVILALAVAGLLAAVLPTAGTPTSPGRPSVSRTLGSDPLTKPASPASGTTPASASEVRATPTPTPAATPTPKPASVTVKLPPAPPKPRPKRHGKGHGKVGG